MTEVLEWTSIESGIELRGEGGEFLFLSATLLYALCVVINYNLRCLPDDACAQEVETQGGEILFLVPLGEGFARVYVPFDKRDVPLVRHLLSEIYGQESKTEKAIELNQRTASFTLSETQWMMY